MEKIKISIIIPCYNVEKFIEKTILSAVNQTLREIEIICVNDGSTDKTLQIIDKYAIEDKRIKIINKKNGGLSSARNAGIKIASGEYIQHLDGDDWIENNCCEALYNYAIKNDLDIVCFDSIHEKKSKSFNITTFENLKENIIYNPYEVFNEIYKNSFNINVVFKLIKRRLYLENDIVHPENISLGEDLVTMVKLIIKSSRIGKLNKYYYHYILNDNSITNSFKGKKIHQLFDSFEVIEKYIKNQDNISKKIIEDIKLLKIRHLGSILYCKPVKNDANYEESINKFIKFVQMNVTNEELNKLEIIRKILYIVFKFYPNKRFLYFLANTNCKIKNFKWRILKQ